MSGAAMPLNESERHELECLRARVQQIAYPCSPHCDGYLRELALRNVSERRMKYLLMVLKALALEANRLGPQLPYNAPTRAISEAIERARAAISQAEGALAAPDYKPFIPQDGNEP